MSAGRTCVFCMRSDGGEVGDFVSRNDCTAHVKCLVGISNGFAVFVILFIRCHSILLPGWLRMAARVKG